MTEQGNSNWLEKNFSRRSENSPGLSDINQDEISNQGLQTNSDVNLQRNVVVKIDPYTENESLIGPELSSGLGLSTEINGSNNEEPRKRFEICGDYIVDYNPLPQGVLEFMGEDYGRMPPFMLESMDGRSHKKIKVSSPDEELISKSSSLTRLSSDNDSKEVNGMRKSTKFAKNTEKQTSENFKFKCYVCAKGYHSQLDLLKHLGLPLEANYIQSPISDTEINMREFPTSPQAGKNKRFVCHICKKVMISDHALSNHLQQHLESPVNRHIVCRICNKRILATGLPNHLNQHKQNSATKKGISASSRK